MRRMPDAETADCRACRAVIAPRPPGPERRDTAMEIADWRYHPRGIQPSDGGSPPPGARGRQRRPGPPGGSSEAAEAEAEAEAGGQRGRGASSGEVAARCRGPLQLKVLRRIQRCRGRDVGLVP